MRSYAVLRALLAFVAAGMAAVPAPSSLAQAFPAKPLRIVVSFPAGGGSDLMARTVGDKLSAALRQPVVVENRPGAGGTVGAVAVARSAPDGYTLLLGQTANLAIAPALLQNVGYDPVKDFAPVTLLVTAPLVLAGPASLPARSLRELIALAAAKPGSLNYASPGNGTTGHLAAELFKKQAGVDIVHVPYKGQAPAMTDLLAGRVALYFSTIAVMEPYIANGQVRAFGVTSRDRAPSLPNVPSLREAGLAGYELDGWFGLFAPAGTPADIVALIGAETRKVLLLPDVVQQLGKEGGRVAGNTPEEFRRLVEADVPKWAGIIREARIRVD